MNIKTEKKIGKGKKYFGNGKLIYEGEYLNNKKMEEEKNIMIVEIYYLKVNIYMVVE